MHIRRNLWNEFGSASSFRINIRAMSCFTEWSRWDSRSRICWQRKVELSDQTDFNSSWIGHHRAVDLKQKQQLKYSEFRQYPEVTLEMIMGSHRAKPGSTGDLEAGREITGAMWKLGTLRGIWKLWVAKIIKRMLSYRVVGTTLGVLW